jgi:uncharacterized protein YlzI (FlbEa/FlbD family)
MSDYQSVEATVVTTEPAGSLIPLSDLKSLFYQLNAKPDTEICLLSGGKIIELSDIRSVNEYVGEKIKNYDVVGSISSITFILSNRKIKDFSTWAEFEREKWDTINERVESLSITWKMQLKLPLYSLPQPHALKLRIGKAVPLKDMLQIAITTDDMSELLEAGSPGICKVDFVNNIIAAELLNIIRNWHEGLEDFPEPAPIQRFLRKHGGFMSRIIKYFFPIFLLIIASLYSDYFNPVIGIGSEVSISNIEKLAILLGSIFASGIIIGGRIETSIDIKISQLENFHSFFISKGDEKARNEFEKNNHTLTRQIIDKVVWILISFVISTGLRFLLGYIKFT